jgi:hypothetical protein
MDGEIKEYRSQKTGDRRNNRILNSVSCILYSYLSFHLIANEL